MIVKLGDMVTVDNPNNTNAKWGVVVNIIYDNIYVKWTDGIVDTIFEDNIQGIQIGFDIE